MSSIRNVDARAWNPRSERGNPDEGPACRHACALGVVAGWNARVARRGEPACGPGCLAHRSGQSAHGESWSTAWQYHFGRGLSPPPRFRRQRRRPSHPELLDYLANELVAQGWRIKPIHRLILHSSAYRQKSGIADSRDPENRLLASFPRRRLDAEEIRDAMLATADQLNRKAGGPSVCVPADRDLISLLYDPAQWSVTEDVREHDRRSIYLLAKRNLRLPFGEAFDAPDLQTSCARRETSTHALQALELLNGPLSNRLADAFARRVKREAGTDPDKQVERAYWLALGRAPECTRKGAGKGFSGAAAAEGVHPRRVQPQRFPVRGLT